MTTRVLSRGLTSHADDHHTDARAPTEMSRIPDADDVTPKVAGVPVDDPDVSSVLYDANMIEGALEQLAALVVSHLGDFEVFVPVTTGAMMFASDLVRSVYTVERMLREELQRGYKRMVISCATCASYGAGTTSDANVEVEVRLPSCDVKGKRVCILEDIIDTGRTVMALTKALYAAGAEEVALIALMDKSARRDAEATKYFEEKNMKIACAFMCPDEFVVGYGLDYGGRYRELPFIGVLKPELIAASAEKK